MLENLELGLIILLTGIVIVFTVLILLILIIKLYAFIVVSIQNSVNDKKNKKDENKSEEVKAVAVTEKIEVSVAEPEPEPEQPADDGTVPGEIVAAIAAAIEVIFGEGNVKIKSIKKSSKRRSVWKSAGVAENTRSF